MILALAVVDKAADFRAEAEDINNAVEEAFLEDVSEVDLVVDMEEEETIDTVEKMLTWCAEIMDHSWRFIRHMNSLPMNNTGCLRQK